MCEPEYFPDKRDSLINDMQNYLKILKAVSQGLSQGLPALSVHSAALPASQC